MASEVIIIAKPVALGRDLRTNDSWSRGSGCHGLRLSRERETASAWLDLFLGSTA